MTELRRQRAAPGARERRRASARSASSAAASGRSTCSSTRRSCASPGISAVDVQRAIAAQNLTTPGGGVDTGPQRLTFRVHGRVTSAGRSATSSSASGRPPDPRARRRAPWSTARRRPTPPPPSTACRRRAVGPQAVGREQRRRGRRPARAHEDLEKTLPGRLRRSRSCATITEITRTSVDAVQASTSSLGALLAAVDRAPLPRQRPQHHHRRPRHPDLDHRHVRADVADRLHAQHHHPAGAGARRRHRHRRRHRGAREHLPLHRGEEDRPMLAAIDATKEIGLAVLATTLSLLAVFLPVAFMGSIPGRFLRSFGLTMACRHRRLAARELLADADAGVALAAPRHAAPRVSARRTASSASSTSSTGPSSALYMRRPRLRDATGAGSSCSLCARDARRRACRSQDGAQGLLAEERRGAVPDQVRTPEGTSLAATELAAERIAREVREWPEVTPDRVTIGDNVDEDAEPGDDLRAPRCRPTSARCRRTS